MTAQESADLAGLERAIRSLPSERVPDGVRAALRRDLLAAASARPAPQPFFAILPAIPRLAVALAVALCLLSGGWAIAASAPGDLAYPIKRVIVQLMFPSEGEGIRAPLLRDVFDAPPGSTAAPTASPAGSDGPSAAPAAPAAPILPTVSGAPARATPAVPPETPGPRATPAIPPPHR